MDNIKAIRKILNKYQNHLNVKFKLICNSKILFNDIYDNLEEYRLDFEVDNQTCALICDHNIDLDVIRISIEDYLIFNNEDLLKKALFNELSSLELNLLKKDLNDKYSMVLIQSNYATEHLYSTVSNIVMCPCINLEECNQIVLLCSNLNELELLSIKDTLETELYCKIYMATNKLFDLSNLKEKYNETCSLIDILIKYQSSSIIANKSNVLLPYIIENIKDEKVDLIKDELNLIKFNELDEELLNTIQVFLDCNLSISETARKMYIHRNTLIYRIEKILSCSGYDIRNFEDALKVKIALILMKK